MNSGITAEAYRKVEMDKWGSRDHTRILHPRIDSIGILVFIKDSRGGAVRAASAELAELEVYTYRTQSILYTNDLALLSLAFLSRLLKIVVSPPSDRSQDSRIS